MEKILCSILKEVIPEEMIQFNEPMSRHTTFRIGGEADALIKVTSTEQLKKLVLQLKEKEIPFYVIGNGSNLLVSDAGYRGVILQLDDTFGDVDVRENRLVVRAGASMAKVAKTALKHSLTGFEFAAGIPGTIGGGVIMNAGAYGGEMKDVVSKVRYINTDGEITEADNKDMDFGYRYSMLKKHPEYIVVEVELILQPGNPDEIADCMQDLARRRREKQPLEYPSAGSTFKRPEGYFAGKLIQDAGLSGYSVGGATVSPKHNGFVINTGGATAADVKKLILDVQEKVFEKFQVKMEPEVIFLGEF